MTSTYGTEPNKQMAIDILNSRGERCQDAALIESDKKKKQAEKVKNLDQHTYVRGQATSQLPKLTVHICRKSSFYQGFSSAILSINWEDVDEINSNEIYTLEVPQRDIIRIALVLPRTTIFKERESLVYSIRGSQPEIFIVVSVENTTPVGLSVGMTAIFGAIGASPDLKWNIQDVSESDFQDACPKAKRFFYKHSTL